MSYKNGFYKVINEKKYSGNIHKIKYRSGWEKKAFKMFDESSLVKKWSSEEVVIPYYDSIKKRKRKYYIDIYVEFINGTNYLFEIKPANKLIKPKRSEVYKWNEWVNIMEKAKAAKNFCRLLSVKKHKKVKFAFLSLIKEKWVPIDV